MYKNHINLVQYWIKLSILNCDYYKQCVLVTKFNYTYIWVVNCIDVYVYKKYQNPQKEYK